MGPITLSRCAMQRLLNKDRRKDQLLLCMQAALPSYQDDKHGLAHCMHAEQLANMSLALLLIKANRRLPILVSFCQLRQHTYLADVQLTAPKQVADG